MGVGTGMDAGAIGVPTPAEGPVLRTAMSSSTGVLRPDVACGAWLGGAGG